MRHLCICAAAFLSGCQQTDEAACEAFVQTRLKAPSTYQRVSVDGHDEQLDWPEYRQRFPEALPIEKAAVDAGHMGSRDLALTYEAQNALGVPLRSTEICRFQLFKGKLTNPDTAVTYARSRAVAAMMADARGQQSTGPGCCE
jgi:hypothetical protein